MEIYPEKINLRSDGVTLPTPRMLKAIVIAELGDDNAREDPTRNRLEEISTGLFDKEAALLVISGTMGNLVGMMCQTQPDQEVILEENAHIFTSERAVPRESAV
jgi:threonine aldolase